MKYHISKENIEFETGDNEVVSLVEAILKTVVPSKLKKLYFSGKPDFDYSYLQSLKSQGLTVLGSSNYEALIRKERIVHGNGYVAFVPVLSGIVRQKEWQPICEKIIANVQ